MHLRKMFAGAAVAATVAGVGLMAAPAAQAAGTAQTGAAGATAWIPWGTYADLSNCHHAGQWAVQNAGASNYTCSLNASQQYDLYIYRV
ncbi:MULTISPECIES: hypothetical protein [Streptomyces]|uniref:Uncharacterized protein n=2 Tax=Streptomyces TaxID=1883 RepID=A0A0W7X905_9ACTN|nr:MULTISPECIES: hypothetical protein [Streptomyces]KUF19309.1 hypothetical protein AT728_30265 [Streptomyces silvensis]MVO88574.1 hypothetical protein [Streptomyces typhae]